MAALRLLAAVPQQDTGLAVVHRQTHGSVAIIWVHFSRISQRYTTPRSPVGYTLLSAHADWCLRSDFMTNPISRPPVPATVPRKLPHFAREVIESVAYLVVAFKVCFCLDVGPTFFFFFFFFCLFFFSSSDRPPRNRQRTVYAM